jgi:hypothetical protein
MPFNLQAPFDHTLDDLHMQQHQNQLGQLPGESGGVERLRKATTPASTGAVPTPRPPALVLGTPTSLRINSINEDVCVRRFRPPE